MFAALKTPWAIVGFSVHFSGTVDTLQGRNTTQRCLDKLEILAHENLTKLTKPSAKAYTTVMSIASTNAG